MCALVTETFSAKTGQELAQIDGLLHDQWFDLRYFLSGDSTSGPIHGPWPFD